MELEWYDAYMTTSTIHRAIKEKKPAVIREGGKPQYVILDWDTYRAWEDKKEDMEDHIRFDIAKRESKGKKSFSLKEIKKKYNVRP